MPSSPQSQRLILASTSPYRRELLERLRVPFDVVSPGVDEAPLPAERPSKLSLRLAIAKAQAVAARYPDAVVIGSDQVCDRNGRLFGKPGHHDGAVEQLRALSGHSAVFHTAVAVACAARGFLQSEVAPVRVVFRQLVDEEIERYLQLDTPYDCAGSARSESLGIALLSSIDSDDPTSLIGLPLIRTVRLLRAAGLDVLRAGTLP